MLRRHRPSTDPQSSSARARSSRRTDSARPPSSARPPVADLSPADQALFEKLRAERRRIAEESKVPAFVVLQDVSLRAMAQDRPQDVAALLRIPGIGTAKAEKYGEQFLSVITTAVDR
jgi:ATP-dependent DNA helicase RecQ